MVENLKFRKPSRPSQHESKNVAPPPSNIDAGKRKGLPKGGQFLVKRALSLTFAIFVLSALYLTPLLYQQEDTVELSSLYSGPYTILPEKQFTVVGKESSGTKFVTEIIRDALKQRKYREGERPNNLLEVKFRLHGNSSDVHVQHVSLPQKNFCHRVKGHHIVDVIYPPQCSSVGKKSKLMHIKRSKSELEQCLSMKMRGQGTLWTSPHDSKITYPPRYFLNISSQKDWYEAHGTEQYIIIVVRDQEHSFKSRTKLHCKDVKKARKEEMIANRIINDAIRTYILEEDEREETNSATAARKRNIGEEDLLWDNKRFLDGKVGDDLLHASLIPARNNVVLVSYEAMMKMRGEYVQQLYNILGIESDHIPKFRDGNAKYKKSKIETQFMY